MRKFEWFPIMTDERHHLGTHPVPRRCEPAVSDLYAFPLQILLMW